MNISSLQQTLVDAGFKLRGRNRGVDGIMGASTRRALEGYNRAHPGQEIANPGASSAAAASKNPNVRQFQGDSSFEAGPAKGATSPTRPGGTGTARSMRGYQETDVNKLRDALPPQAKHLAETFNEAGKKYNVDPAVLAGISQFETGNWRSSAFRNKNNAMGLANARGPIRLSSAERSIDHAAQKLADPRGYYRNASTLAQVGRVYAPVGASNDPRGTNGSWAGAVARNADRFAQLTRAAPSTP